MLHYHDLKYGLDRMAKRRNRLLKMFMVIAVAFNQLVAGLAHAGMLEGHNHLNHDHATVVQPHDHSAAPVTAGHEHHHAARQDAGNTPSNDNPTGLPNNTQHDKHPCCAVGFSPCGVVLPVLIRVPEPLGLVLANGVWQPACPKSWRNAPLLRPPILLS